MRPVRHLLVVQGEQGLKSADPRDWFAGSTGAHLSADGLYRYALWRRWAEGPAALFVMLNPSTADAVTNDATITRCLGFARKYGYSALLVGNLFAYRTSSPDLMKRAADPVGPENDTWLRRMKAASEVVVAAWGNDGDFMGRPEQVRELLGPMKILKRNETGQPGHPLYVPGSTQLKDWR